MNIGGCVKELCPGKVSQASLSIDCDQHSPYRAATSASPIATYTYSMDILKSFTATGTRLLRLDRRRLYWLGLLKRHTHTSLNRRNVSTCYHHDETNLTRNSHLTQSSKSLSCASASMGVYLQPHQSAAQSSCYLLPHHQVKGSNAPPHISAEQYSSTPSLNTLKLYQHAFSSLRMAFLVLATARVILCVSLRAATIIAACYSNNNEVWVRNDEPVKGKFSQTKNCCQKARVKTHDDNDNLNHKRVHEKDNKNKNKVHRYHQQPRRIVKDLKWGLINARSLCNKTDTICELLHNDRLDVLAVTETWLTGSDVYDSMVMKMICGDGYSFVSVPRSNSKKGGGVALLYRGDYSVVHLSVDCNHSSFEFLFANITTISTVHNVCLIYRPPASSSRTFLSEFSDLLNALANYDRLVILGDFNIDIAASSTVSKDFCNILSMNDFHQHVNFATHDSGHIIDLLLTRKDVSLISNVSSGPGVSDHISIFFNVSSVLPRCSAPIFYKSRPFHRMDLELFSDDLYASVTLPILWAAINIHPSTTDLVGFYNSSLKVILDRHAPIQVRRQCKPRPKWISPNVMNSRRTLRRAECVWRSSHSPQDREIYCKAKFSHRKVIIMAKKKYFSEKLAEQLANPRALWAHLHYLTGRTTSATLPSLQSKDDLAGSFHNFFNNKVMNVRSSIPPTVPLIHMSTVQPSTGPTLSFFDLASEREVSSTIMKAKSTTCELDPIPTWLLRRNLQFLLPALTVITNRILDDGLPGELKNAVIKPLLKKANLNPEELSSYRPVSNLPFISKVIERVVAERITRFLDCNNKHNPNQYAYRANHSCETALTWVLRDAYGAIDGGGVTLLVLLDLTAAFDVIDHSLLLSLLQRIGFEGSVLSWMQSYLEQRTQKVICCDVESSSSLLGCGVPQGSVLGPLLFSLYISEISSVMDKHNVNYALYADDIQVFMSSSLSELRPTISRMEKCIEEIKDWLTSVGLILNCSKTEFIIFAGKANLEATCGTEIMVDGTRIVSKAFIRDLGVTLDSALTMERHVNLICKSAFYHLRVISKVRKFLSSAHAAILVSSLAISRIDYCASLLHGISKKQQLQLQKILHYSIRMVDKLRRNDSVSDALIKRKWLSIQDRVKLRLAVVAFVALKFKEPKMLASLISPVLYSSERVLRSQSAGVLMVPRVMKKIGERSFAVAAPKLLNALPESINREGSKMAFKEGVTQHMWRSIGKD